MAPDAAVIEAEHGVITNDPREIVLDHPHLSRDDGTLAGRSGGVLSRPRESGGASAGHGKRHHRDADAGREASRLLRQRSKPAIQPDPVEPRQAVGNAQPRRSGGVPSRRQAKLASHRNHDRQCSHRADRATTHARRCRPRHPRLRRPEPAAESSRPRWCAPDPETRPLGNDKPDRQKGPATGPQDFELTAPVIDFTVAQGHILEHAETSGAAQITIAQAHDAAQAPRLTPTVSSHSARS